MDTCNSDSDCFNGGSCLQPSPTAPKHCSCLQGFNGPKCGYHCPLPCANGGVCRVKPIEESTSLMELDMGHNQIEGKFYCKCLGSFTGPLCNVPFVSCGRDGYCFNGGYCQRNSKDGSHECVCPSGWIGHDCGTPAPDSHDGGSPFLDAIVSQNGIISIAVLLCGFFIMIFLLLIFLWRRSDAKHNVGSMGKNPKFRPIDVDEYSVPTIEDDTIYTSLPKNAI